MRWSQLKKLVENILDPDLDLQMYCTAQRGEGGAQIGRYWLVLNGETVWDQPPRVSRQLKLGLESSVAPRITSILREYLDTPKDQLLTRTFENDHADLIEILKVSDRRIGKRRLAEIIESLNSPVAQRIAEERLQKD